MDRKESLLNWLREEVNAEITEDEITDTYNGYQFDTPEGEYLVLDEDEARKAVTDDIENLIDDIGIYGTFSDPDYVVDNFCQWYDGDDYMREDYYSYLEDIESEGSSDDRFSDRMQEELWEFVDKNYGDADLDEFLATYEENKDDLKDEFVEDIISQYDNPIEWAKEQFGDGFVRDLAKNGNVSIDYDAIADWCISEDGYGNSLATYDGRTNEYSDADGDYWLIFRTN